MVSRLDSYVDTIFTNYGIVVVLLEYLAQQRIDINCETTIVHDNVFRFSSDRPYTFPRFRKHLNEIGCYLLIKHKFPCFD